MGRGLHRAPLVVPGGPAGGARPVIEDGGVLIENGRILAVGRFLELAGQAAGAPVIDHEGCLLAPALVNAHTHLELSHLAAPALNQQSNGNFTAWVKALITARERQARTAPDQAAAHELAAGRRALDLLFQNGTILAVDLGNHGRSRLIGANHRVRVVFLREFLGLSETAEQAVLQDVAREVGADERAGPGNFCTAHAPYSTSPELLRRLKKLAHGRGHLFSIHVAESVDELEFLQQGTGKLRQFLQERGAWDGSFAPPGLGAVSYLDHLGVLDAATLCVHVVYVSPAEIGLLAKRRAKICLCPGSNRQLAVGKAPVPALLDQGLLPALGTDSLASNRTLDIWREMRLLREDHPGLEPAVVFSMATRGGAEALGLDGEVGSLAPGRRAAFLAVRYDAGGRRPSRSRSVFEFLTAAGESAPKYWVE